MKKKQLRIYNKIDKKFEKLNNKQQKLILNFCLFMLNRYYDNLYGSKTKS